MTTLALRMTVLWLMTPFVLHAQQPPIPVRPLGPTIGTSAVTFMQVQHLRALSDGHVLVNDPGRRQVVLLDSSLASAKVVVDSAGGVNMYGPSAGALIPFAADSTLFVDRTASAFLVITPNGDVTRVMSMPPGNAVQYLTNPATYGYPTYSPTRGILYRLPMPRPQLQRPKEGEMDVTLTYDDSALVMAMDVRRRTLDTVAKVATGSSVSMKLTATSSNTNTHTALFPIFDEWAVMTDGATAVLRGREYRIDFYGADGARTLGPRLMYPWKRVDDGERQRLVDSINAQRKGQFDEMIEDLKKRAIDTTQRTGPGGERIILVDGMPIRTYNGERMPPPTPPATVQPTEIPDYLPAVERNSAGFRADADNRLWIRPKPPAGTSRSGGMIYEVVDRSGALVDRVQLPPGRTLAGFGPGGIVYLTMRDAGATRIEKHRFK